jgi:hypothetical protein
MFQFLAPLLGGIAKGGKALFGGAKPKIDPTMAAMMGLSFLGGGDEDPNDPMKSFEQPGANTDPKHSLNQALEAVLRTGQGLQGRGPVRLRSSVVQPGPAPVQLKGIPFQIGGGLGRDPALADPSLLEGNRNASVMGMDPFQSLAKTTPGGAGPDRAAKRREPK